MVAVGSGTTVIVALPAWACEQPEASWTLTRLYVKSPISVVGALRVALFPVVVETVVLAPELRI
jgi:hypothetical protein